MNVTYPDWLYKTTYIYHITHIDNLPSILESGYILSTNNMLSKHASIANKSIQESRSSKKVVIPPHGCLHDYVPFYFAPRSPMLCANHMKNMENAKPQEEIIHLVSYAESISSDENMPFVFYDRHAIVEFATPYNDVKNLNKIDWELFFEPPLMGGYSKYWQDKHNGSNPKWFSRKEIRQAEFLVHEKLPWKFITVIATMTENQSEKVRHTLNKFCYHKPTVHTLPSWYY